MKFVKSLIAQVKETVSIAYEPTPVTPEQKLEAMKANLKQKREWDRAEQAKAEKAKVGAEAVKVAYAKEMAEKQAVLDAALLLSKELTLAEEQLQRSATKAEKAAKTAQAVTEAAAASLIDADELLAQRLDALMNKHNV